MYRIIMLSLMAIVVSSCSSIKNIASAVGKRAEPSNISHYTKSSFMEEYALSEDEYNEWRDIVESKAHEIFMANGAESPDWQDENHLYVGNNPLRVITIPNSEVQHIELSVYSDRDPKVKMYLLDNGGIYFISNYQEYVGSNSGQKQYDKIFHCKYSNYESLARQYNDELGELGRAISKESWQYLKPKKESKEEEEERLAKEAERLEKEKIKKALSDKRMSIKEQATKTISEINNRKINTLQLRELYVGMPAEECVLLLNYYLGLPTDESSGFYTYDDETGLIVNGGIFNTTYCAQQSEDKKVTGIYFTRTMIDKILNASSLEPRELAQAIVDKFNLVPSMEYGEVDQTFSGNSVYGWKYTDAKNGFRISISENNTLLLQSVAKNAELTF